MKYFFLIFSLACASASAKQYPVSDHYDGDKFFNPGLDEKRGFFDFLKWQLFDEKKTWPDNVPNIPHPAPVFDPRDKAILTFINHATYLIQLKSINILTDPVFSDRVSPVSFAGPKRVREPGLELENLPPIHVVILSHNHYDHMDVESLRQIDAKFHPLFLVPLGDEKRLKEWGIQNVKEMDWWQEQKVQDVSIVFTRVLHWSSRTLWDKFESLWGGYMIQTPDLKIYFGGDTGYSDHFKETYQRLGAPDVALLPVGAYEPRWFMKTHHMNPEEAVQGHIDLKARTSLPMHFGTFQLTNEGYDDPILELRKAREKLNVPAENFPVIDQGESFRISG